MNENQRRCPECNEIIEGRTDKKFCTGYCKSAYHYRRNRDKNNTLFKEIDVQLKLIRRILRDFNRSGKSTVRQQVLLVEGFNPNYFTHYWKNKKGQVYLFCYEYGFLALIENNQNKYVLVKWQPYMAKSHGQK